MRTKTAPYFGFSCFSSSFRYTVSSSARLPRLRSSAVSRVSECHLPPLAHILCVVKGLISLPDRRNPKSRTCSWNGKSFDQFSYAKWRLANPPQCYEHPGVSFDVDDKLEPGKLESVLRAGWASILRWSFSEDSYRVLEEHDVPGGRCDIAAPQIVIKHRREEKLFFIGAESFDEIVVGGPARSQESFNPAGIQWNTGREISFISVSPIQTLQIVLNR